MNADFWVNVFLGAVAGGTMLALYVKDERDRKRRRRP